MLLLALVGAEATMFPKRIEKAGTKPRRDCGRFMVDVLEKKVEDRVTSTGLLV